MNRDKAYRKAVYETLRDVLITVEVNGAPVHVPVFDNKLEGNENDLIYVLMEAQTAQVIENFALQLHRCSIEITVYHRQQNSATFDIIDDVSEMVEEAIIARPGISKFALQLGWQIDTTYLQSSNSFKMQDHLGAGTLVSKTLMFSSQLLKL